MFPPLKKRVRLFSFFILLFYLNIPAHAQQNFTDSLLSTLPVKIDTSYIVQLQKIVPDFPDKEDRMKYSKIALTLSEDLGFWEGKAESMYYIGKLYQRKNDYENAIATFDALLPLAKRLEDTLLIFSIYNKKGQTLLYNGQADESFQCLLKGLEIAEGSNNIEYQAEIFYQLGDFHRLQHNFDKAIENFERSLILFKQAGLTKDYCWIRSCIAMTYKRFDDIEKKRKGIELYEVLLSNECSEVQSFRTRAIHYNNLGSAYVDIGDLEKGEEVLFEALAMKREIKNKISTAYTLNEIATLFREKDDYQSSLKYGKEAYGLVEIEKEIYLSYDITRNLSSAYYHTGNYKRGYEVLKEFQMLSDTILNEEKAAALAEMTTKHELKEKENAIFQKDLLIAQQSSRFNRYLLIGLFVLGIVLVLFLWSRWRFQKKQMETQKLQELDLLKSNFFTNITHEFRTPLTVILNSFSNKKNNEEGVLLSLKEANIIERNTHRLQNLINQLLDLSKLEAGKMELQITENNICQFLKTLTHSFDPLAAQKNIKLQFFSQQNDCSAFFDIDKIEKIITNLIVNAIKFTPEGGEVSVLLLPKGNRISIVVKDTGIGIAPEALGHIFDRFHQVDNSETRNFEGSGIGLALVEQMVKVHLGTIEVDSSIGKGTIFTVELPGRKEHYKSHQLATNAPFVKIAEIKRPLIDTGGGNQLFRIFLWILPCL